MYRQIKLGNLAIASRLYPTPLTLDDLCSHTPPPSHRPLRFHPTQLPRALQYTALTPDTAGLVLKYMTNTPPDYSDYPSKNGNRFTFLAVCNMVETGSLGTASCTKTTVHGRGEGRAGGTGKIFENYLSLLPPALHLASHDAHSTNVRDISRVHTAVLYAPPPPPALLSSLLYVTQVTSTPLRYYEKTITTPPPPPPPLHSLVANDQTNLQAPTKLCSICDECPGFKPTPMRQSVCVGCNHSISFHTRTNIEESVASYSAADTLSKYR